MAFFRSRMVNLLNLHYGIHSIALSGAGAFFAVYLLKAGLSVAWVLGSLALILAGRFLIRPIVVPLAVRFGMRPLVIAGTCLTAVQYPLLAAVHGVGPALFVLCAIAALGDTFYWSSYHAYFAALGNHEHRGSELGAREAIAAMAGIVSPLATGILLVAFGPLVAFGSAAVLQVSAALPLFFTPEVAVAHKVPGAFKAAIPGMVLFLADGWIAAGYGFVWQIVLFLSLAESFTAFGGALALAALVGAAAGLLLGRLIDAGHGRRAVWYGLGALAVTTILRAVSPGHALLAVIANALGALVVCLYIPTLMTAVYNQAKSSPCALRFHVAAEGAWDVGAASGCLVAATLAAFGVALSVPIMLSLLGAAALFLELRRYYAAHPTVAELALADSLAQNAIVNSGESALG
ncbi:MAG: MFS transporter [Methyloceanibacter sp.]|jgi:DHA1 family inner membrane transport protein